MLLELLIFAVVLTGLQMIGGFILFKYLMNKFTNKEFLTDYMKKFLQITEEIQEELYEEN